MPSPPAGIHQLPSSIIEYHSVPSVAGGVSPRRRLAWCYLGESVALAMTRDHDTLKPTALGDRLIYPGIALTDCLAAQDCLVCIPYGYLSVPRCSVKLLHCHEDSYVCCTVSVTRDSTVSLASYLGNDDRMEMQSKRG